MQLPWITGPDSPFPPTAQALTEPPELAGLLAAGGDLSPARLAAAYRRGIFPWFGPEQPVLWWTPDPRMVLRVADFKCHRSLRQAQAHFAATPGARIVWDGDVHAVITACAQSPRGGQAGTWIGPGMIDAYVRWHAEGDDAWGRVHSVETWVGDELIGGLYGVRMGQMFFGESMFARRTDASKLALAALVAGCRAAGMPLIDCQQQTAHLASLGAAPVSRQVFESDLAHLTALAPQPMNL